MNGGEGARALDAIVDELGARARRGEAVALLWDMDGTLVDTRLRMLTAVHAYGRTDVKVQDVTTSWQETAQRHGLDRERFQTVWNRVFWAYESFDADVEIELTARRARRAEELGVQNIVITGRVEELRGATRRQLDRLKLACPRMFLKSTTGDITPAVKAQVIDQLKGEGLHIGAFVTDSREEIQAAGDRVPCIFVDLEGAPGGAPPGASLFTVPVAHPDDAPPPDPELAVPGGVLQFGFEAEYDIDDSDRLLLLYRPEDVEISKWRGWSREQRAEWVRAQFPVPHSEDFDLPVVRATDDARLGWLPERLIIDSDGNVEVISPPTSSLSELWTWIETLEHVAGPALWQATHSAPAASVFADPAALDGFLSFHGFLDSFERMAVGHEIYRVNPEREVLLPFAHPWLGPVTRGKHRFLRMYLESNPKGERLDDKWTKLVKRAFSSFKYIGGSAYRPSLAGPDRVAIEIRDAHANKALLARRLVRNVSAFVAGLAPFKPFADTWAFDSEADYERLSAPVRKMLESAIPSTERADIAHMYSKYDCIALQTYRHWALPMKDYADVARAIGAALSRVDPARAKYVERLEACAAHCAKHDWSPQALEAARRTVQGALSAFAVESGLAEALEAFRARVAALPERVAAEARVRAHLPAAVVPRTAWTGALAKRLERLAKRWPKQVAVERGAAVHRRDHSTVKRDAVLLTAHGLDDAERARLLRDWADALAGDTLALQATDRGGLEATFGGWLYAPGACGREPATAPTGSFVPLLSLAPLEAHALRRHLAAHDPCWYAATRVSASGWARHLAVGQPLERALALPAPAAIETAAQVVDAVVGAEAFGARGWVAGWLAGPLAQRGEIGARRSTLDSGFPATLERKGELGWRLERFVARWPRNAKLVPDVPFAFGKGEQRRTVLVIAMAGLSEDEAERLRRSYLDELGADTISFPLREAADHLRTRIGDLAFAVSPEGVRVDEYQAPSGRRRIEAVVTLTEPEMSKLRAYAGGALDDTLGVLGPITMHGGARDAKAQLDDNRPIDGGRHNCTTWVTLAPIGDQGETLATLAQMPPHWTSHDNPGWWSLFLTGASRSARARYVIYWTAERLADEPLASGQALSWDFNPK